MAAFRLFLLGTPCVECDGAPIEFDRRKALALLAYLALSGGRSSRDVLAALLWPEYDDVRARAGLRRVLATLNETPASHWLVVDRETVTLKSDGQMWVDVHHFNTLMEAGNNDSLVEAINLYQDGFMSGFSLRDSAEFDDWQTAQT
jgi:DNA-binding SARP family transcriptional activator